MTVLKRIPPHLLVAASAWASRVIVSVIGLFSIRVLMKGIGAEQYAVSAVLGGLLGWYMLADMGVGISLQNHISERRARNEPYQGLVAAAGVVAMLLLLVSLGLLLLCTPFFATTILKQFTFLSPTQKTADFLVVGVMSILFCIGGIGYKIWYAEQKGYLANLMPAVASVVSLCWLLLVTRSQTADKLFWCLVANFAPLALLPFIALVCKTYAAAKSGESINRQMFRPLLTRALKFWGFGIMAAGVLQIDYIMMSQFLPAHDIVVYTMCAKVFGLFFFVYNAVVLAVWPVFAESIAAGNWGVVKRKTRQYILLGTGLIVAGTVALVPFMPLVVSVLSPNERIEIPVAVILMFGLYFVIRVWTDTYTMVLQSMSFLRPFWICVPFQALFSIAFQWYLIPRYGVCGVLLGLTGSFVLTASWFLPVMTCRKAAKAAEVTA